MDFHSIGIDVQASLIILVSGGIGTLFGAWLEFSLHFFTRLAEFVQTHKRLLKFIRVAGKLL